VSVRDASDGTVLDSALRMGVVERVALFGRFFHMHPGTGRAGIGLGRAVVDFLAWEVQSGRVADEGGSPWWAAVNGLLALDVASAGPGRSGATSAWQRYATAPPLEQQAALWRAHGESMARAVESASPLLADECEAEREFIAIVLRVLDRATVRCTPTDSPQLGDSVRRSYPAHHPIRASELAALKASFGSRGHRVGHGPRTRAPGAS